VYLNVFKWIGGDYPKSPKKSSLISLFAKEYLNGITSRLCLDYETLYDALVC
jgi:hypothetical protein